MKHCLWFFKSQHSNESMSHMMFNLAVGVCLFPDVEILLLCKMMLDDATLISTFVLCCEWLHRSSTNVQECILLLLMLP